MKEGETFTCFLLHITSSRYAKTHHDRDNKSTTVIPIVGIIFCAWA